MGHKIEFDLEEVERLASFGLTLDQVALALGIAQSTLYAKKAENTEFSEAIKRGQAKGIHAVANKLFDNAMGGNVTAQLFYLKARAQWRDTPPPEKESDTDTPSGVDVSVKDARKPNT